MTLFHKKNTILLVRNILIFHLCDKFVPVFIPRFLLCPTLHIFADSCVITSNLILDRQIYFNLIYKYVYYAQPFESITFSTTLMRFGFFCKYFVTIFFKFSSDLTEHLCIWPTFLKKCKFLCAKWFNFLYAPKIPLSESHTQRQSLLFNGNV